MIKAVTIDLWGTLVVDSPATDERYRRERLAGLAMEPLVLTREQTIAFIKLEIDKWRKVAIAANVRID